MESHVSLIRNTEIVERVVAFHARCLWGFLDRVHILSRNPFLCYSSKKNIQTSLSEKKTLQLLLSNAFDHLVIHHVSIKS